MSKKKSNPKQKPQEVNEFRLELERKLQAALDLQKTHKDRNGISPYDDDVRKAIAALMIESSKETLAERAKQTYNSNRAALEATKKEEEEQAQRLENLKKEDEERTPYLAPLPDMSDGKIVGHRKELIDRHTNTWLREKMNEEDKFWREKDKKFYSVYDRLMEETRERLLIEAQNPTKTDAEYDDLAETPDAEESNVIMLPSNKKTNAKDLTTIEQPVQKLGLWKRFKLWLISILQD